MTRSPQWDIDAQWSPDGALLSFSRFPPHQVDAADSVIWTIRRDGTDLRRLVRGYGARWSPEGKRLVFAAPTGGSDGDLFIMNTDGTERRLLLATPEAKQAAAWSPDGRKILFTRGPPGNAELLLMDADGSHERTISDDRFRGYEPSWR
jgi:TolB protein